jgi:arsenite methyltransferase
MSEQSIKEVVKEKYGQAALRAKTGGSSCCGAARRWMDAATRSLRTSTTPEQTGEVPEFALLASLGCGNPTALAHAE